MFADVALDGGQWLPILEKAYAKISVNYEKMGLGWMDEAMRILNVYINFKKIVCCYGADRAIYLVI